MLGYDLAAQFQAGGDFALVDGPLAVDQLEALHLLVIAEPRLIPN